MRSQGFRVSADETRSIFIDMESRFRVGHKVTAKWKQRDGEPMKGNATILSISPDVIVVTLDESVMVDEYNGVPAGCQIEVPRVTNPNWDICFCCVSQ